MVYCFQEYVDSPVPISFKVDKRPKSSLTGSETVSKPDSVAPGLIYAVRTNCSAVDGYLVCKAVSLLEKEFQAVYFKRIESACPDEVCFIETIFSYMLSLDSVIGNLVSARILENVLHISAVEVEELLISSIDL